MRQNSSVFVCLCQGKSTLNTNYYVLSFLRKWQGRLDSNQRMPRSKPGALPLGDAPNLMLYLMAGAAGFEPTDAEIKTRCLTTWRRP